MSAGPRADGCTCGNADLETHLPECPVVPLVDRLIAAVEALPEPTLGLKGGVNRGAVIDIIRRPGRRKKETNRG